MAKKKTLKIGIFGLKRGSSFLRRIPYIKGVEVTAVVEKDTEALEKVKELFTENTKVYETYEEMLDSGIDAVILANYFPDHAKCAIQALEKKIHVLSETTAAPTLGECVALCAAVEKSKCKYMLAANTPFMPGPIGLREEIKKGAIGKVLYGEAEYLHPRANAPTGFSNTDEKAFTHWRKFLPRTYYNMHSLGALMQITDTVPVKVSGKAVYAPDWSKEMGQPFLGDVHSITVSEMDNGAVFTTTGHSSLGPHSKWFRLSGDKGNAETLRFDETGVRVDYMGYCVPEDCPSGHRMYYPLGAKDTDMFTKEEKVMEDAMGAKTGSHYGNCDFWLTMAFIKYLRDEIEPPLDVYKACALSAAGILSWRSIQNGGKEYDIPDFKNKRTRKKYANDFASPFLDENGENDFSPCSHPEYRPLKEMAEEAKAEENK